MPLANETISLFPTRATSRKPPKVKAPAERNWRPLEPGAVLLAIDPSSARCGWAILHNTDKPQRLDSGVWYPTDRPEMNRTKLDDLAVQIRHRVNTFHANTDLRISHAVIETPAGGQWGRSATQLMVYARAIGVCEATCYGMALGMNRVTVNEWKGSGKKSHTANVVRHFFNYQPRDDNEADAIGLGLWLCSKTKFGASSE